MKIESKWKPIKLRAEDDSDLQIFSQCLYEAIVLPSEIKYNKSKNQFAMALERFTWEVAEGKDYMLLQVLSILVINGVRGVEAKKNKQINKIKSLLSISNVDNNILILLNDEDIINLNVKKWSCTLEDIGKPISPATTPNHFQNG